MTAILSDIHANFYALEAVLADMPKVDAIWSLGDMAGEMPFPCETMDRLLNSDVPIRAVKGNRDEAHLAARQGKHPEWRQGKQWGTAAWTTDMFKPHHWDFFESLPQTLTIDGALLFHGRPNSTRGLILEEENARVVAEKEQAAWLFCGHTHMARQFLLGRQRVVNVGSVGVSLNGIGGTACYVLFDGEKVVFRQVSYDVEKAVAAMTDSAFMALSPGIVRATAMEMRTGRHYVMGLVQFAQAYAERELGYAPSIVPAELWDAAERAWDGTEWLEGRFGR